MNGLYTPDAGTVKTQSCDVCGADMDVQRNVHGATGFAEAMAKHGHLHDRFTCPHREELWHKQVYAMTNLSKSLPSQRLAQIIEEEVADILRSRVATKDRWDGMSC
jgi:hypothetical protein